MTLLYHNDDDVVLYSAVPPWYCSMLCALGRVVSFAACCQSCYLACKSLDTTLLFKITVQKLVYMYPSVSKVHAGSFRFSVSHRTLTWTTGSLTCVRGHSYACAFYPYAHGGWPHRQRISTTSDICGALSDSQVQLSQKSILILVTDSCSYDRLHHRGTR